MAKRDKLFDYVLVVALDKEGEAYTPKVTYQFPPIGPTKKGRSVSDDVVKFCFPEISDRDTTENLFKQNGCETFSFTLTESDSSKRFGYCRRFLGKNCECFCLLSFFPSFSLFSAILDCVEERRMEGKAAVFTFLRAILAQPIPGPGETVELKVFSTTASEGMDTYTFNRADNAYEHLDYVSFYPLCRRVSVEKILFLFESLLFERRIIVMAKTLATLSSCVHAITALVHPFTWQHIFIPILPVSLISYCCAPMPFIVGLLASSQSALDELPIEECVIINLDTGNFTSKPVFTGSLPQSEFDTLKQSLKLFTGEKKKKMNENSKQFSLRITQCFLRFFASIFSEYTMYFKSGKFDRDAFIKSRTGPAAKFLEAFGAAQMFEMFIYDRENVVQSGRNLSTFCTLADPDIKFIEERVEKALETERVEVKLVKKQNKFGKNGFKSLFKKSKKRGTIENLSASAPDNGNHFSAAHDRRQTIGDPTFYNQGDGPPSPSAPRHNRRSHKKLPNETGSLSSASFRKRTTGALQGEPTFRQKENGKEKQYYRHSIMGGRDLFKNIQAANKAAEEAEEQAKADANNYDLAKEEDAPTFSLQAGSGRDTNPRTRHKKSFSLAPGMLVSTPPKRNKKQRGQFIGASRTKSTGSLPADNGSNGTGKSHKPLPVPKGRKSRFNITNRSANGSVMSKSAPETLGPSTSLSRSTSPSKRNSQKRPKKRAPPVPTKKSSRAHH